MGARAGKFIRTVNSHLMTNVPVQSFCYRCKTVTLRGVCWGIDTQYDVWPLSQLGEVEALMHGHHTYELDGQWFKRREAEHIRRETIPLGRVIRNHICGRPVPTGNLLDTRRKKSLEDLPEDPPF